ncbi:MAG: Fic family protein [Myxococcales bacterium]|jgi:hypothetical protein
MTGAPSPTCATWRESSNCTKQRSKSTKDSTALQESGASRLPSETRGRPNAIAPNPTTSSRGSHFAASLLLYVTVSHCFGDGNKRIGWAAMCVVLLSLGLTLETGSEEAATFVARIAKGEIKERVQVVEWIAERLAAAPHAAAR